MKRIWNVAALGAVIVLGLGTFVIDMNKTEAEWELTVKTNPDVWADQTIDVFYETENETSERFEVTTGRSRIVTNMNYIEEAIHYRDTLDPSLRGFYRQMKELNFAQSIHTDEGYVGLGQNGNQEIVLFKSTDGETVTSETFKAPADVMEGSWAGLFVHDGDVHLIFHSGYEAESKTKLAVLKEGTSEITIKDLDLDNDFVSEVLGTSWFYNRNMMPISTGNRFIPVRVGAYESFTENGETHSTETNRPGLFAYDIETNKVVQLASKAEESNLTVHDNELMAVQLDGSEIVVDLMTGKPSTRQVIDGSVGTTTYVGNQLYHVRPTKDGAVIDVYEDGKEVSSAAVNATNEEAKLLLDGAQFYVR